jgi:hypothetical protein
LSLSGRILLNVAGISIVGAGTAIAASVAVAAAACVAAIGFIGKRELPSTVQTTRTAAYNERHA